MYLIYKTDNQHSYSSRDLIGVTEMKHVAVNICQEKARKENKEIDEDQLFFLNNYKQTQGYPGDGEFYIEQYPTNILL